MTTFLCLKPQPWFILGTLQNINLVLSVKNINPLCAFLQLLKEDTKNCVLLALDSQKESSTRAATSGPSAVIGGPRPGYSRRMATSGPS